MNRIFTITFVISLLVSCSSQTSEKDKPLDFSDQHSRTLDLIAEAEKQAKEADAKANDAEARKDENADELRSQATQLQEKVDELKAQLDDTTDNPYGSCLTKELWSAEKTKWCCENQNLGCQENPFGSCFTKELWSAEKTKWCCENQNLGCKI